MKRLKGNITGATMVEAAMVLFLLLFLIFSIVEFGRFYAIKARMNRAVARALERAIRDERLLIEPNSDPVSMQKLANVYRDIDNEAISVPTAATKLANTFHDAAWVPGDLSGKVLILRPGENGRYSFQPGQEEIVTHPTAPAPPSSYAKAMETNPVLIEMHGTMKFILPFFGEIPIQAQAIGYPEKIKRGIDGIASQIEQLPYCGDGIFDPSAEQCELDSNGNTLNTIAPNLYCKPNCLVAQRCGNGIIDPVPGHDEDCDYGRNANGHFTAVHNKFCTQDCKKIPADPCMNFEIEFNPDGSPVARCDIKLEELCQGYRTRKAKNQLNSTDFMCQRYEDYLVPDGYACIQFGNDPQSNNCSPYRLPQCNTNLVAVPCPGEAERPGQEGRFSCFVCQGEGGECADVNSEMCFGNNPNTPPTLSGIPIEWYCKACYRIEDKCGNGRLDTDYAEECDPNPGGSPLSSIPIPDDHYCSPVSCKIEPRCGNSARDSFRSYVEQCDITPWAPYTVPALNPTLQCVNCMIECRPDPNCSGTLQNIGNRCECINQSGIG